MTVQGEFVSAKRNGYPGAEIAARCSYNLRIRQAVTFIGRCCAQRGFKIFSVGEARALPLLREELCVQTVLAKRCAERVEYCARRSTNVDRRAGRQRRYKRLQAPKA